jgi:hypothetical protein
MSKELLTETSQGVLSALKVSAASKAAKRFKELLHCEGVHFEAFHFGKGSIRFSILNLETPSNSVDNYSARSAN